VGSFQDRARLLIVPSLSERVPDHDRNREALLGPTPKLAATLEVYRPFSPREAQNQGED
jgi:hypothetical protein